MLGVGYSTWDALQETNNTAFLANQNSVITQDANERLTREDDEDILLRWRWRRPLFSWRAVTDGDMEDVTDTHIAIMKRMETGSFLR
jgi:hypothetical protein